MSLVRRLRLAALGIVGFTGLWACGPLPEVSVKAYEGPDRPASELSVLQVSGCASAIRVDGVDYNRNCNPRFVLLSGAHVVEVRQARASRANVNCTQDETTMSWKRDFCDTRESYFGVARINMSAGHVYYLGVCKWQQLWIEDLTRRGAVVFGMKPQREPNACPDLRQEAVDLRDSP